MAEMRNPVRTLKIAAPVAISIVSVLYMLANIAYFAAVPREEIVSSGRILAASFFRNVFGPKAERALSVFVAFSAFGNVLSVIFSQGRLVQEIGREGILPFSRLWASNKPANAPFMGLFEHWVVSVIIMLAPPPGDAYNFSKSFPTLQTEPNSCFCFLLPLWIGPNTDKASSMLTLTSIVLNVISYPLSIVNAFVAFGLTYLYFHRETYNWHPPIRATLPVTFFFFLSNLYLAVAPYVPPEMASQNIYTSLPYWLQCPVGLGIIAAGGVYWLIWAVLLPRLGGYRLEKEVVKGSDGWTRNVFVHVLRKVG
jgi:amino acid transporter